MAPSRRALVSCAAIAAALGLAPAWADGLPDPFKLYGNEMVFAVWRQGSEIGSHRVTFAQESGALVVRSVFDIAVKLLGITVYRFNYQSQEQWRDGRLERLDSTVNDDGKTKTIEAREQDGALAVTAPRVQETVTGPILPSTHWNAQVITATRVLNTLDGKISNVKLVPLGVEQVPTNAGPRQATHYKYAGDIQAESWYDADGRWVKLRFPGSDGSMIDYVCQNCVGSP